MSSLNFKQFYHIWTQQLLNWLTDKFNSIDIDTSDLAKEAKATSNKNEILTKIENTQPDLSTVAKETSVKDGNDTSVSVAKEVRSEVGTGSDTAAETGTLSAVLKWVKDKVKSIYNLIGTPAIGQPSTLFAAIAAGGDDAHNLAEFFGVTLLQGYEFMTDTEVTDELEDIMQALDPELTAEQAASITAQAMQIINPSQS